MRWLWGGKEVAEMAQWIKLFVCKHKDLSLFSRAQGDNARYGGVLAVIQDCGGRGRQSSEVYWQVSLPDLASSGVWELLSPKYKKQSRKHLRNTRGWPLASTPYPSRCKCTPARNASTHREGGHCTLETWVIWLTVQLKNMQKLLVLKPESQQWSLFLLGEYCRGTDTPTDVRPGGCFSRIA